MRLKPMSSPGREPVRTRLQAAASRGLTRFVGRNAELDRLRMAWQQAAAGHGQVVAVVGEPGVGKSRLFYEFARSLLGRALAHSSKADQSPTGMRPRTVP